MSKSTAKDHARAIWCMRLRSALRTALACAIVGGVTLYGPKPLVHKLKFPAFSYVIVIIILSNATTLGHALSGCWHALYATIQVVPLAMLARWLISPRDIGELPVGVAAIAATVASFLVTLPKSTHLTAKRIALGQIALICTEVVVVSNKTSHGFMNPLHIGTSAILGAVACLLASLLPFPGLAYYKVQNLCDVYAENATERMDIYLKAFNAKDRRTKTELVLQANPIAGMGTKLLQIVKTLQEGIPWERPWSRYSINNSINVENRLQSLELPIRAIEYSLVNNFPSSVLDQEQLSVALSSQLKNKIEKVKHFSNVPVESNLPVEQKHAPFSTSCFMSSCMDMLLNGEKIKQQQQQNEAPRFRIQIPKLDLESALKCSISMGLALLLGVTVERDNARWAALTVAISFASGSRAIFTTANARAQGSAMGSVYGVIFCFLFHQPGLRLLALLPWIALSTFLKHSSMYGQTGGISAAIGASVILGRKNYGPPNEFAIGRLTAVFVGLFSLVFVEIVLQRARSATLAKRQLRRTLVSLGELIKQTRVSREENDIFPRFRELRESREILKSLVADAESEPGFWYLPFQRCCYGKVVGCLYNVMSMLYVVMHNLEVISELRRGNDGICAASEGFEERLNYELEVLEGIVNSSLEKVFLIRSSQTADCGDSLSDVEAGKLGGDDDVEKLMTCEEVVRISEGIIGDCEDEKQIRVVRCLGAIGFCIASLRREIDQIEICIKEIVRYGR